MTGVDVVAIGEAFGLQRGQLAQLLGVHYVTVQRWVSAPKPMNIDPMQRKILAALEEQRMRLDQGARAALGAELARALDVGGTLAGLHALLRRTFE